MQEGCWGILRDFDLWKIQELLSFSTFIRYVFIYPTKNLAHGQDRSRKDDILYRLKIPQELISQSTGGYQHNYEREQPLKALHIDASFYLPKARRISSRWAWFSTQFST